jgi:L-lactate dehydrogenase (cytochrome)/(S)-mandelate dehydrogenase
LDQEALARRFYNIETLRRAARRVLPRVIFDFADGGAEDEGTLRRNETDFDELELVPRMMRGVAERDLSVELFGRRLALPVLVSTTGLSGILWPDGEACAARAAQAAGTVYCQSHGSSCTIEELAAAAPGPRWFQVFLYRDRGLTRAMAERAQAVGCEALILTVDNQVLGQRERDLANGFAIPPRLGLNGALDMALHPRWVVRMRAARGISFANYRGAAGHEDDIVSLGGYIARMLDPGLSWQDVAWLRGLWRGPFLLKGILHPEDARIAAEHGVDGVIVSNHGGRQLDGAVSAIRALPAVAEAVGDRLAVLLDGGVRRGVDVLRAVALGARAVAIGRPHWWGLAVAGEAGVALVLDILRRELDRAMALSGCARIADIDRALLAPTGTVAAAAPRLRLVG